MSPLLPLVLACSPDPELSDGLSQDMAAELWYCNRLDGPARDWCAVATLPQDRGTGLEGLRVCERLDEQLAVDRCIVSMVLHDDPAPSRACASVRSPEIRASCWVGAAEKLSPSDLDGAWQACERSEDPGGCLALALATREPTWVARPYDLTADLEGLLAREPGLAFERDLGLRSGHAAWTAGYRSGISSPCGVFGASPAWAACEDALEAAGEEPVPAG